MGAPVLVVLITLAALSGSPPTAGTSAAPAVTCTTSSGPRISALTFGGSPEHPTVTVHGCGFAPRPVADPPGSPIGKNPFAGTNPDPGRTCTDVPGDRGSDFGSNLYLVATTLSAGRYVAATAAENGELDCIGLVVTHYADSDIELALGSWYAAKVSGSTPLTEGQQATIHVRNAVFTATVHYVAASRESSLAASLATPADAFSSVPKVAGTAVVALGITLFIVFPAELFNLTLDEAYPGIRRRLHGKRGPPKRRRPSWPVFAVVVVVGALLGSMLDPSFGWRARTGETFSATLIAHLVGIAVAAYVAVAYRIRRHYDLSRHLHALPLGLGIAAFCVLVSRLSSFQPGYLYGIVAVVAFKQPLTKTEQGRLSGLQTATTLTLSLIAWLIWLPVHHVGSRAHAFWGAVVLDDLLAAIFVAGLTGSVITLLPLLFLPGWKVRLWHQGAWLGLFAASVFAVLLILVESHSGSDSPSHTPLAVTLTLFVVFAVLSIGLREYVVRRRRRRLPPRPPGLRAHVRDLLTPAADLPVPPQQNG